MSDCDNRLRSVNTIRRHFDKQSIASTAVALPLTLHSSNPLAADMSAHVAPNAGAEALDGAQAVR